jgi:hypothetical protein
MSIAKIQFQSLSPISFSRYHNTDKLPKEAYDDYERRTWRNKLHVDENDQVLIGQFMIMNCLSEAAKFLSIKIPGRGQSTYTKHFEAGVALYQPMGLGILKKDVQGQWMHVPSDGKRGGGKRVMKCFPVIPEWEGTCDILILDETITRPVLKEHLEGAGRYIGLGSLRPRNNGMFGRFRAEILEFNSDPKTT